VSADCRSAGWIAGRRARLSVGLLGRTAVDCPVDINLGLSRARWLRKHGCNLPTDATREETRLADTTAEVKAILARAVRELEQVIDNRPVKSEAPWMIVGDSAPC